ncbi:MAG: hypothetical protein ACYC0V_03040 [Armatimonadota bacterium]
MSVFNKFIRFMLGVGLLAIVVLMIYFYSGTILNPRLVSEEESQISPSISEHETDASRSWQILVSTTRRECSKDKSGAALDYESLHKYTNGAYGVMVLAWPQSEYMIELYRYDPSKKVWTASPRRETDFGDEIDVAKTSAEWSVPKNVLNGWINEAVNYMKKKYGNGDN